MKRLILPLLAALLVSTPLWAPPQTQSTVGVVSSAPSGSCVSNEVRLVRGTDEHYSCSGGQWTLGKTKVGDLAATNSPAASLCLSVDPNDTTKVQYILCSSGGGGGGTSIIKECSGAPPCAATSATTSTATTLAFGPAFDVSASTTTSSNDTANITLDLTEQPVDLATSQITGVLPVANGGTNASTAANARSNLGAAASGANSDITSLTGTFTAPLSVSRGGTSLSSLPDDNLIIGGASAPSAVAIPNCPDSGGNHLNYATSTNSITCGNTGSGGAGSGYATIDNDGSALTTRTILNIATSGSGTALVAADNSGSTRTDVTLTTSPTGATAVVGTGRTITPGTGLTGSSALDLSADRTLSVDSTEAGFLASGTLTCGASTAGKAEVNTSTPLQYCDNAATPTLQYAAYGDSSGNAKSGDSATAFFTTGTLGVSIGGTGATGLGTTKDVLFNLSGVVSNATSAGGTFNYDPTTGGGTLAVGSITTNGAADGSRYVEGQGNTSNVGTPASGFWRLYGVGTGSTILPFWTDVTGGTTGRQLATLSGTETFTNHSLTRPIITSSTVAALTSPTSGQIVVVTDGNSASDCTTGTGSTIVLCRYNGSSWQALGDGTSTTAAAGGSTTQVQYNNGGSLGGMSGVTWTSGSSKLAFADATLLDLSAINASGTGEGLLLPQAAAASLTSATAEGQLSWATDTDTPYWGTGAAVVAGVTTSNTATLTNKTLTTPTLTLKQSTTPTPTAEGDLQWDTDDNQIAIGDGTATQIVPTGNKRSMYLPAGGWWTDNAQCIDPAGYQINSGAKQSVVTCTDNNAATFWAPSIDMPDGWDGGTIVVELVAVNAQAIPNGTYAFDISAQCIRDGNGTTDVYNNTWGTTQAADFTESNYAQYEAQQSSTTAITPSGTCIGGAQLNIRGVVNATRYATTDTTTNFKLLGLKVVWTMKKGD